MIFISFSEMYEFLFENADRRILLGLLTAHHDDVGSLLGRSTFTISLMMGSANELAIAVLRCQMPIDLLHGGGQLDLIVGVRGDDIESIGVLVGGHIVNIP